MEVRQPDDYLGAQSVERSMALLVEVARFRKTGASLGEVVAATRLKQPTARRLLLALIRAGLIEQDEVSRRYFLGPQCYVLGTIAAERYGIHRLAMDSVQRLARLSQDTAFITIRNGQYSICVERQEGTFPIRSHVLAVGDRHPLGIGAGSLAILAALSDAEVEENIAAHRKTWSERYPQVTAEVLRQLVANTRRNGYALNPGMVFPGSWGIGVAICDPRGEPVAALSIAAIESRLTEAYQAELAPMLREEARLVETQLHGVLTSSAAVTRAPTAAQPDAVEAAHQDGDRREDHAMTTLQKHVVQPGPMAAVRVEDFGVPMRRLEFVLEAGRSLVDAVTEPLAAAGITTAGLALKDFRVGPTKYVKPAVSPDKDHVAFYSETFVPERALTIEAANITFGSKDGKPFVHCHAFWREESGDLCGGHLLPFDTFLAAPARAVAVGCAGVTMVSEFDAETNFTLFHPVGAAAPATANGGARASSRGSGRTRT